MRANSILAIVNGGERFKADGHKAGQQILLLSICLIFNSEFKLKYDSADPKGKWIKHLGNKDGLMT